MWPTILLLSFITAISVIYTYYLMPYILKYISFNIYNILLSNITILVQLDNFALLRDVEINKKDVFYKIISKQNNEIIKKNLLIYNLKNIANNITVKSNKIKQTVSVYF